MNNPKRVLIGITGGIAAYKMTDLVSRLTKQGVEIEVMMTEAATKLVSSLALSMLSGHPVYTEMFREQWSEKTEVEHIAVADRADLMVIVPATADIMAKAANGIADDFVSSVILAADSPVIYFPAMNTRMWEHPATQSNVAKLRSYGFEVIEPDSGFLACGTEGVGRLGSLDMIEKVITDRLFQTEKKDLKGKTVLISAGPTEEPIDPVRTITNHSSGKMGYALAKVALMRGAEVHLVSGPVVISAPAGVNLYPVVTAGEMQVQMEKLYADADITVMAAAVSDYRMKNVASQKLKKQDGEDELHLELVKNPDILAGLGKNKHGILVGFAAETEHLKENATAKLIKKNVDMIIANDVTAQGAGFGTDTNIVTIYKKDDAIALPMMTKEEVANRIFDEIMKQEEAKL